MEKLTLAQPQIHCGLTVSLYQDRRNLFELWVSDGSILLIDVGKFMVAPLSYNALLCSLFFAKGLYYRTYRLGRHQYNIPQQLLGPKNFPWQRDLFKDSLRAAGLAGVDNGTKLYISNLNTGVTNEDIRVQFEP
ncbi:hypothetical protein U1Q18_011361 [Sarracenia purpurea var. burkii]